ncbi:MAG: histidine kinase [Betaproteobacteria bacterium]|nr:histidine kinase [Betaproteobacteria bacterium]
MGAIERDEMRRFLRRWSGRRGWLQFALVIGWNTLVAVAIASWTSKLSFLEAMSIVNLFVFSLAGVVFGAWFGFRKFARTLALLMAFAIGGAFLGVGSSGWLHGESVAGFLRANWVPVLAAGAITGLALAALSALIGHLRNREYVSLTERLRLESRQEQLSRQMAETRLHLLQAQIEPHFLFNTLASAQQLAAGKAPEAAQLLGHLTRFLRAAMPRWREGEATLGQEIELIAAYLAIMQTRLGARLAYAIAMPPELAPLPFPSAMLMTLVENAIKHGIEPLKEGGEVRVSVQRDGARLVALIADTGAGMGATVGAGVGLDNIRERLKVRYGDAAALELAANEPRGFIARMEMPCPA